VPKFHILLRTNTRTNDRVPEFFLNTLSGYENTAFEDFKMTVETKINHTNVLTFHSPSCV